MDMTNRDRLSVLEAMFDVVNESTEWVYNTTENRYGYYIEGVVAVTERLLREIDERPINDLAPESSVGGYVAAQDSIYATHGKIEE